MSVADVGRIADSPDGVVDAPCAHCGLPAPATTAGSAEPFCCPGCETAFAILHNSGLARYYDLGVRRGVAVAPSGRAFDEYDHEAFTRLHVRPLPGGGLETDLFLEGVHCASCVWLVERVPLVVPGALRAELDLPRGVVRVAWDPTVTSLAAIARFLDRIGYRPHPYRNGSADQVRRIEDRAALQRIGVAGAITANTMLAALALYSGWFGGMEDEYRRTFRWLSLALTLPALVFPGRVFFLGAWGSLRARALHMDVPVALALLIATSRGVVNTVTDRGPIYFDGVTMLVFLLLVGRFLQQRATRAAADSGELLHALAPATARRVSDGTTREVPVEALLPGMEVEVRHGETVPADGIIVHGEGALDVALLTGESRPQAVKSGSRVYAGTQVLGSMLRIRVEQAGEATRVGQLMLEVASGQRRRAPVVRSAEAILGVFLAIVLALAALTWLYWLPRAPLDALDHAVALLIVTCPCALALATPLAVSVAVGRAARRGMLVRGGDALESMARPGTLVLDKTGTLTEGRLELSSWEGPDELRGPVRALERHATHPVATAIERAWPGVVVPPAEEVTVTTGGVVGRVGGRTVVVGSPAFVASRCEGPPPGEDGDPTQTPVWVGVEGRIVGAARFRDPIRAEAASVLAALRRAGWRIRLLSGDDPAVVDAVADQLGFAPTDRRGGASPEDKRDVIEDLERQGRVVMVGDGVNDAAAIARATVGIGIRGGAEACLAAADVFLVRPGLSALVELAEGAARTLRVIRWNIAASLIYNVVGASLAIAGLIDPLVAAILMPTSSLTVVMLSWRLRTFAEESR